MKWVKTKDRKPNYDFEIIFCDIDDNISSAWYRPNGTWEDCTGEPIYNVIYWRTFPKPPRK